MDALLAYRKPVLMNIKSEYTLNIYKDVWGVKIEKTNRMKIREVIENLQENIDYLKEIERYMKDE